MKWLRRWRMALLAGLTIAGSANAADVSIDPSHRYFRDTSGNPVFLLGYYAWSHIEAGHAFHNDASYDDMIADAQANNLNYIRISLGINYFPGAGTEEGVAAFARDVNGKHDLEQFEPRFWAGVRHHVEHARDAGLMVHLAIFDGVDLRNANNHAPGDYSSYADSPWKHSNQAPDSYFPELDHDGNGHADDDGDFYQTGNFNANLGVGKYQRKVIDKVIAETGGYDNVFYEVGNELYNSSDAWQNAVISYIRNQTAKPITANVRRPFEEDLDQDGEYDEGEDPIERTPPSNADGLSRHSANNVTYSKKVADVQVGNGYPTWVDPDCNDCLIDGNATQLRIASWLAFTHGAAGWGGFTVDYWGQGTDAPGGGDDDPAAPDLNTLASYKNLQGFIQSGVHFWQMVPNTTLISSPLRNGLLVNSGQEYAAYIREDSQATIDLTSLSGSATARIYDAVAGTWGAPTTVSGGAARTFDSPNGQDWAIHIIKNGAGEITAPLADSVLVPGQSVTATGTGSNLTWEADLVIDGLGAFATGTGSPFHFTVPANATADQVIELRLTSSSGTVSRQYAIQAVPQITFPQAGATLFPGQNIIATGTGPGLTWEFDLVSDGLPAFTTGSGASASFTVPANATTSQLIEIRLTSSNGQTLTRQYPIGPPAGQITAPLAGTIFGPGDVVTATGTGTNLSWEVDRLNDGLPAIASATGPNIIFTVPSDSTDAQSIKVKLTSGGVQISREFAISTTRITAPALGTIFTPGQPVTATATGIDLSWEVDCIGDGLPAIASGTGSILHFNVPANATSAQTIKIKLTSATGSDSRVFNINGP